MTDTYDPPAVDCGVAFRPLPGETDSGDRYVLASFAGGLLAAVVDGLGHGVEAAAAAERAVAVLRADPAAAVADLVLRCHDRLKGTRGVVLSLASLDARREVVTWLAVGNAEGVLLRAGAGSAARKEFVLQRGGVVGYQLPPLRAAALPLEREDVLVLATDGIYGAFTHGLTAAGSAQTAADGILAGFARETDDALVLVVRWRPDHAH